ncbi:hypothetical protein Tco_1189750 [Tanacetum coccineum]
MATNTLSMCGEGRSTTAPRGRRTSGQTGRGGGRTGERPGRDDLLPTIIAQVGNHVNNQENNGNRNDNLVGDNIQGDVRNVNVNHGRGGCSYKEFLACNPKEYDGKGGAIVYTRWIEKIESSDVLKAGVLTDEAIRNGSIKKNTEKRGNGREPSRDGNVRDDKKRSRTRRAFATTTNLVRKEYTGTTPKCTNCNYHHLPEMPCRTCANCNRFGHFAKYYRVGPRMVNLLNARNLIVAPGACFECGGTDHYKEACPRLNRSPGQGGNRPNQVLAVDGGQGLGNNGNQALGRAFMLGAEETH